MVGLDAALGKLGVEIVRSSGSLMIGQVSLSGVNEALLLLHEFTKLLLLKDVSELFPDELKLLLIENINMLVYLIVKPCMLQDILCCSPLLWRLLKHGFHEVDGILGCSVFVFNFLIELLNCI